MKERSRFSSTALAAIVLLAGSLSGCSGGDTGDDVSRRTSTDTSASSVGNGYTEIDVTGGGAIRGRVIFDGMVPKVPDFEVTANQEVCGTSQPNNRLRVAPDGGVADAVIYLEGIGQGKALSTLSAGSLTVDQRNCRYHPHVVVAPVGGAVAFVNSDEIPHNVRVEDESSGTILMNRAQAAKGQKDEFKPTKSGVYMVECDYHPWMNSYVVVVDHPYAVVSSDDGSFEITGVPAGSYSLRMWMNGIRTHAKRDNQGKLVGYGFSEPIRLEQKITVTAGETVETTFRPSAATSSKAVQ